MLYWLELELLDDLLDDEDSVDEDDHEQEQLEVDVEVDELLDNAELELL